MPKEKSLYEQIQEEYFFNRDIYSIRPELAEKAKLKALKELEKEGERVTLDDLLLIPDVYEMIASAVEREVPPNIFPYVDIIAIIRDEIYNGYLDYIIVTVNSATIWVFWFTR